MTRHEVHGIAVNTTARISAIANVSEILVSHTVKDLVAGSGNDVSFGPKAAVQRIWPGRPLSGVK